MREIGLYPIAKPSVSTAEKFRLIREAGFDYVAASKVSQLTDCADGGFLDCAEREKLPIDNVHLTGSNTNLVWFEGKDGDDIIDRYCSEMDIAVKAGVPLGIVHVTWGFTTPPFNDIGLRRFDRLVKHAEKVGFVIAFENSVCLTHLRGVVDRFDSPCVRFCFDSGHHNEFCPDSDVLYEYNDLLAVTHINDNDGVHDHHVIPFDGTADFAKSAKGLKKIKRLTFEVSGFRAKECKGTAEEIFNDNFASMSFSRDKNLLEVHNGGYSFYPGLSYAEYLERLMNAAKKLSSMIDEA